MQSGNAELEGMLAVLRELPQIARQAAPELAEAVRVELQATAAAGTSATGQAWLPRKSDGGRAMADAADAIKVAAVGTSIVAVVRGPEALHHRGFSRGGVRRSILPTTSAIPPKVQTAVRDVLDAAFAHVVRP